VNRNDFFLSSASLFGRLHSLFFVSFLHFVPSLMDIGSFIRFVRAFLFCKSELFCGPAFFRMSLFHLDRGMSWPEFCFPAVFGLSLDSTWSFSFGVYDFNMVYSDMPLLCVVLFGLGVFLVWPVS
jgi:hypothetical protein